MTDYSTILGNVLLPAYDRLRGRAYSTRLRYLQESQWWTAEKVEEAQWKDLVALLCHAYKTVPFYKRKFEEVGARPEDIHTREQFARLPVLTSEEVNSHRKELCSSEFTEKLIPHSTGGSSGQPTRFFITHESYDWRCAASERAYSWAGCKLGTRALYLWGAPVGHVSSIGAAKLAAYRWARRQSVVSTFAQSRELWHATYQRAVRFKPVVVVGYVSSLEEFSKYLLDENVALPGLRSVIAAAEPVHEGTRRLIEEGFKAPLFNTYGCREFMSVAAECELHDGLHINSENLYVETEGAADLGSQILVTDLHNYGMPMIRYRNGDLGILKRAACPCGRGLPLIASIDGRVLDLLRTADGRVVPGEFFPHLLKDIHEIREFQVEQTKMEEITLSVVLNAPIGETSVALLNREIGRLFGKTRVMIKPVESIPLRPSGKRRVTIGMQDRDPALKR